MASDAGYEFNAIPIIDLRMLTQSDLQALSISSNSTLGVLNRLDNQIVIPKIDRTVFNESAGSRKQTYSRFRLAPRNPKLDSYSNRTRLEVEHAATSADDRVREENRLALTEALKELFSDGTVISESEFVTDQDAFTESLPKWEKLDPKDRDVARRIQKRGRRQHE